MKKTCLILLISGIFISDSFAQFVGIGTPTPSNTLHVVAATDPLRIEGLVSGAPTDEVLTTDNTGVVRRRALSAITGSWSLLGNLATNPTTNFLGTLDLQPLVLRTNNQRSGFIEPDNTKRTTSFGNRAIAVTPSGVGNSAFGFHALNRVTSGFRNSAFGDSSSYNLTTGYENVTMGSASGRDIVGGFQNVLIGIESGQLLSSGFQNVAIGYRSLATNSSGSGNIAVGYKSLEDNFGAENIAIGVQAMSNNTGGSSNIAVGSLALLNNLTGFNNYAIGSNALGLMNNGSENLAYGNRSLDSIVGAVQNTGVGHFTFGSLQTGNYNTALGYQAAGFVKGGSNNTFIGFGADVSPITLQPSNSTAIGCNAIVTQSNMVRVGVSTTTLIGGSVGFTVISDERVKTNIRQDVPGLNFITKLRPVTYNYDPRKMDDIQGLPASKRLYDGEKESIRYTGLLAQEVQSAAVQINYDFSGVNVPKNINSLYGINYSELVMPLVQAVKELKAIVDQQQLEITQLKAALNK